MQKSNKHTKKKKKIERFFTKIIMLSLLLLVVVEMVCSWGTAEAYSRIAKVGCQDECGGVQIPFPFGIGDGCYYISNVSYIPKDTFRITCDNTARQKPILVNREVLDINIKDHTLRVSSRVAYHCNTSSSKSIASTYPNITYSMNINYMTPISVSVTRNQLVAIGCDATAIFRDTLGLPTACTTSCRSDVDPSLGNVGDCDSLDGCCKASVGRNLSSAPWIYVGSSSNYTRQNYFGFDPCIYAFVGERVGSSFGLGVAVNLNATSEDCDKMRVPVLYDWFVTDNQTCGSNTNVITIYKNHRYRCQCLDGYTGNPYLLHSCQADINQCLGNHKCNRPIKVTILGVSIGMSSVIGLIILYGMYKLIKRRKDIRAREHNFKRNGGLLLQQEMSTNDGAIDRTKIFSQIELEKATDNFNDNRILGSGGQGTVYKGMLVDGTIVAVKKSKKVDENQLAQFINEVVILSQINHRNIVKLFGCCLETDVPLLVYEFVPNGTLYQHIHHPSEDFHMTWKVRFQIAVECAGAVGYLHSSCSSPIYHRDIKSSNILLDEKYKAKVSDFGTSRTISIDKTHITTCVQGTFGYLDPEFFRSSQFSEKSDVYSFGVVLLELLTNKKPIFTNTFGEPRGLAIEFIQIMEASPNMLYEILDTQVLQHCSEEEIDELAKLIERCLSVSGKQRPTMREVAMTLETIKSRQDKEGNPVAEREIRGEERHVWIEETSTTNEDPSINSTTSLPR